jgi:peptidylprolyl isomerase
MKKIILILIFIVTSIFAKNPVAVLETNSGNIEIELMPDIAPKAVENFITHIKNGYYNGLIFHRVIRKFMIQGGDPTGTGRGGESIWEKPFEDEFSPKVTFDKPFLLAMANAGKNTNGSQFFITTVPTPHLNGYHTIFGKIIDDNSKKSIRTIEYTDTDFRDRPKTTQKIIKAYMK